MAEIKVTKENFNEEVINSDLPVLIDFWATWCGPCRMLAPVLDGIAEKYEGKLKIGKVNVDEENELADSFGITSIPMLALIKNGKVVSASVGYKTAEQIEEMLDI